MTTRNEEMLEVMVASQQAHLDAMQASSAASGKPAQGTASSVQGLDEESIWANERSRISLVRLQSIQKGPAKPAGTTLVFPHL